MFRCSQFRSSSLLDKTIKYLRSRWILPMLKMSLNFLKFKKKIKTPKSLHKFYLNFSFKIRPVLITIFLVIFKISLLFRKNSFHIFLFFECTKITSTWKWRMQLSRKRKKILSNEILSTSGPIFSSPSKVKLKKDALRKKSEKAEF